MAVMAVERQAGFPLGTTDSCDVVGPAMSALSTRIKGFRLRIYTSFYFLSHHAHHMDAGRKVRHVKLLFLSTFNVTEAVLNTDDDGG